MWNGVLSYKLQKEHGEDGFIAFASKSKRFIIARVILLLVFLPAVYGTWKSKSGIPDFKNLAIWQIEAVTLAFSKVSM